MISIAIVDDEQMYLDKEKRITEEYFRRKGQECRIELFQDAEWLLCELEEKKFDIYVLDVEMPARMALMQPEVFECCIRIQSSFLQRISLIMQ